MRQCEPGAKRSPPAKAKASVEDPAKEWPKAERLALAAERGEDVRAALATAPPAPSTRDASKVLDWASRSMCATSAALAKSAMA